MTEGRESEEHNPESNSTRAQGEDQGPPAPAGKQAAITVTSNTTASALSVPVPPARDRQRQRAELEQLVAYTAKIWDLLAGGNTPRQASLQAQKLFGISRFRANRYVAAVLKQMHDDASMEPLESKRARMAAILATNVQRALTATRSFEQNGKVVTVQAPDFKAANGALNLLAEIDGLKRPDSSS